jgi:hypothetical protein
MPISVYDPNYAALSTRFTHLDLDGPTLSTTAHIRILLRITWMKKRYIRVLFRKTVTYSLPIDQGLCRISSTSQYAHQNVERTACYRDGSSKLCSSSDVSPTRNGRSAKRGTVSIIPTLSVPFAHMRFLASATWTISSHRA